MTKKDEFDSVKETVEVVLEEDEKARNDDTWLIHRVLERYCDIYIPYDKIEDTPSFETITRCRRKLQNDEGKYLPDEKVEEKREEAEGDVREWVKEQRGQTNL